MSKPKKRTRKSPQPPHVTREEVRQAEATDPSGQALVRLLLERKVAVRITRDEPIIPLPSLG